MPPADFSHYRLSPEMVVRAVSNGHRITDEELLEVLDQWRLPIGRTAYVALRRLLDPKAELRGRPSARQMSRAALISRLRRLRAPDFTDGFVEIIVDRLEAGAKYTLADSSRAYARKWRIRDRNMIIRGVYDQVYDLLAGDPAVVEHPILGIIEVPVDVRWTRHEKALRVTRDLLATRTNVRPPATTTIANIVSMNPVRKRRPRT